MYTNKLIITFVTASILLVVFIVFKPVLTFGFVNWDDDIGLADNPLVRSLAPGNIVKIFLTPINTGYSPLVVLSNAVEYHFFKLDPFVYHLDNLLLHLAVIWLAFQFFLQLKFGWQASVLAVLLFGIHPLRVESVAWVAERKDVLYAFFYLLSLNFYLTYLNTHKKKFYFLTVLLGFLSMLSKPAAATLPLVLYLCDWFYGRKFDLKVIVEKFAVFLYVIPLGIYAVTLHPTAQASGFVHEALITVWAFVFYIDKFLFPFSLGILYELPKPVSLINGAYVTAILLFILWVFLLFKFKHKKVFIFANLFYLLSISVALRIKYSFSPGNEPYYAFADRFMYIPSLGFCLLIGLGIVKLMSFYKNNDIRKALICALVAMFFIFLSLRTYAQTYHYENSFSLWNYAIASDPSSAVAYNNRGVLHSLPEQAITDFNKCLMFDPNFAEAYFNRGQAYFRLGEYEQSIRDYTRYLAFDPNDAETYYLRSRVYDRKGDHKSALQDVSKAGALGYNFKKKGDGS